MRNMNKKVDLLVIDPQFDFVDKNGTLSVPGAKEDMQRLAAFVEKNLDRLDDIHVSLDQHHLQHIASPNFWTNSNGDMPTHYTEISESDVVSGKWVPKVDWYRTHAVNYLHELAVGGKYPHRIWPPHCLIGSPGAAIEETLFKAFLKWEADSAILDVVSKGSNPKVEHFSIVKAEVLDPEDAVFTGLNIKFIRTLEAADQLLIAGEALLHCVRSSFLDIADNFSDPNIIKKIVFLKDCSSPVPLPNPGYQKLADDFYKEMEARGVTVTTTDKYQF